MAPCRIIQVEILKFVELHNSHLNHLCLKGDPLGNVSMAWVHGANECAKHSYTTSIITGLAIPVQL